MADGTGIEWTDATWNPIRGCSRVSEGCRNCYAETVAARFSGPGQPYEGLARFVDRPDGAREARWTGEVQLVEAHLTDPVRWQRPRRVFVNSMSDLFHEKVPDTAIDRVFAVMALAPRHTFQVLTKRPERLRAYCSDPGSPGRVARALIDNVLIERRWPFVGREAWPVQSIGDEEDPDDVTIPWPLPNVWLGVSVEDQVAADTRIPILLATQAAVRFISAEPLLGPVNVRWSLGEPINIAAGLLERGRFSPGLETLRGLDWIIVGGESGPGARPFYAPWARSILHQCQKAGVACFIKQMGGNVRDRNDAGFDGCENGWNLDDEGRVEHDINGYSEEYQGAEVRIHLKDRKGGDWSEWPEDLRVREFPARPA